MNTFVNLIKKNDLITTNWSGGTTTQLAIHPENADYSDRAFNWRLSTATVEVDESNFTSLPDTRRLIMSLSGDLELIHENHHRCKLKAFEVDRFDGAWSTKSIGKVIDFNLMLKNDYYGDIKALSLSSKESKSVTFEKVTNTKSPRTMAIYCVEGNIKCECGKKAYSLHQQDILILETSVSEFEGIRITNDSLKGINAVVVEIGS